MRQFTQSKFDSSQSPLSPLEKSKTKLNRTSLIEEDVFRDLVDPVLFIGPASRSTAAVDDSELEARDLNAISIRPVNASQPIHRSTSPHCFSMFRNPWAIYNILDLWHFFKIWITLLIALQIYASLQITGIQNMAMKVEWMWLAPANFCLIAVMSYLAMLRRFGKFYHNFIPPLAIISIVSAILAASPMFVKFFSKYLMR